MGPWHFHSYYCLFYTSHLVLQSCCQRANKLVGLSLELRRLQHWSEGTSSEELLLWMRSQHWRKALPPLAPVSSYTNCYLCTCILLLAGCTSSLLFCRAGLIWRSQPLHQDGMTMARSPPHTRARASGRDNRGGGSWSPTPYSRSK